MNQHQAFKLLQQNKLKDANEAYQTLLQADPRDIDSLQALALIAAKENHWDTALSYLKQAINLAPNLASLYNNQGNVFLKKQTLDLAKSSYREALRLKPDYPQAHYNLANLLKKEKDHQKATIHYHAALTGDPDYLEAYYQLALLYCEQGDNHAGHRLSQ